MNQVNTLTQEVSKENKRLERINRDLRKVVNFYENLLGIDTQQEMEEIPTDTEFDTVKVCKTPVINSYIL